MALVRDAESTAAARPLPRPLVSARGAVTTLLCALFAIMYLDRVNISAAAASLKAHFGLTNTQMGLAFSAFSWAYLVSALVGGWGARRYGARLSLIVTVAVAGVGTVLTGFAGGLIGLFVARLVVGLGEGPAFPAATQAMRNWYPPHRFGYIQGITHSASRLGAAVAPPIVAAIIIWSDWRTSFIVCGLAALVWAAAWWWLFKEDPREHPDVEARYLEGLTVSLPDRKTSIPLWSLSKRMFPVTIVTFAYGWSYWIFVSWLPLYFANQHHTDLKKSALLTSMLFMAGLVGNTVGGVGSDIILKRSGSRRLARCGIVAVSLASTAVVLTLSLFLDQLAAVVALLAVAMFFLELTIAPMYAVTMDITKDYAAFGSAYVILGIALSGIVSPVVFGWLIDLTGNWNVPFATGVVVLLAGAVSVIMLRPDVPFAVPDTAPAL